MNKTMLVILGLAAVAGYMLITQAQSQAGAYERQLAAAAESWTRDQQASTGTGSSIGGIFDDFLDLF